jgi:signal transduction histidine kinase
MLALINDMLSLTRIRSMEEAGNREMVALGPLVADVVEAAQNAAQSKSIKLRAHIDPDLPSISAVRNNVKQLFAALVENAVKYTPDGGKVDVTAELVGAEVRVAVADTGIGVPPDERESIFGEFNRAANARAYDRVGSGLGLAIARGIAQDLGGRIELDSVLDKGSTFTVILPIPGPAHA